MKAFDLEKALAGEKVVTRGGKEVTQLTLFEASDDHPLAGVVDGKMESFTEDGVFTMLCEGASRYDLFMYEEYTEEEPLSVQIKALLKEKEAALAKIGAIGPQSVRDVVAVQTHPDFLAICKAMIKLAEELENKNK